MVNLESIRTGGIFCVVTEYGLTKLYEWYVVGDRNEKGIYDVYAILTNQAQSEAEKLRLDPYGPIRLPLLPGWGTDLILFRRTLTTNTFPANEVDSILKEKKPSDAFRFISVDVMSRKVEE